MYTRTLDNKKLLSIAEDKKINPLTPAPDGLFSRIRGAVTAFRKLNDLQPSHRGASIRGASDPWALR